MYKCKYNIDRVLHKILLKQEKSILMHYAKMEVFVYSPCVFLTYSPLIFNAHHVLDLST